MTQNRSLGSWDERKVDTNMLKKIVILGFPLRIVALRDISNSGQKSVFAKFWLFADAQLCGNLRQSGIH